MFCRIRFLAHCRRPFESTHYTATIDEQADGQAKLVVKNANAYWCDVFPSAADAEQFAKRNGIHLKAKGDAFDD